MRYRYIQSGVLDKTEIVEDPLAYMEQLAQTFLPLQKFGFKESVRFLMVKTNPTIIYDSKWCRVAFDWERWEMYTGNSIGVKYGRLHALDGSVTMKWEGEECYCWHSLTSGHGLDFLDGLSPQESVNFKGFAPVIEQFRQSELFKTLNKQRRGPELRMRIEASIWEHYSTRLFELFALHRPELWEQYRQFWKAVYDIKGRSPNIKPSLDKVC